MAIPRQKSAFAVDITTADATSLANYFIRFPRPVVRVFLDYMGQSMNSQAKSVRGNKEDATRYILEETEKARGCIAILVHKKYDGVPSGMKASDLSADRLIDEVSKAVLAKQADLGDTAATLAKAAMGSDVFAALREAAIAEAKKVQTKNITVKVNGAKAKAMGKDVLPEEFEDILGLAAVRQNILLTGPSGCGKTHAAGKVAEALELEYGSVSCSVGMSESHLAGWLLPVGKAGKFEHVAPSFVECYEQGGVFLFDEIDAADENTLLFVNSALANEGFSLPQRYEQPWVQKHKDFVCVAAANTFGQGESMVYSGRNQLDGATLDRFRAGVINMDYSAEVESKLVDSEVLDWGRAVRRLIAMHNFERIMSTRVMLDFTKQKERLSWGLDKFKRSYFADWSPAEVQTAGELAR